MHVSKLALTDFRGYAEAYVELAPGPTAFIGPNGQGKTNLVEAIGYVATLDSHRVSTDAPLVRQGAERAIIRCEVQGDGRATLVEIEINPGRANRARINRGPVPRPREVLGLLRSVLFAPEDLQLVKGDPDSRRRFLDDLLIARSPRYHAVRADYDRVLKQRNTLLKTSGAATRAARSGGGDLRTLDVWDEHLARHGSELLAGRLEVVDTLRPLVDKSYDAVSGGSGPTRLDYRCSLGADVPLVPDRDLLAAAIAAEVSRVRPQELERGVSLVGPHRDDLVLSIGDFPAKGYASHGESWSLALALRLASHDLLAADGGEPVLVLDDVFAELDTRRRDRLAELVVSRGQVLVTAAVVEDVPEQLVGARFDVMAGEVTRVR
ncbi:MAG TPA: DNA replication/repair protein RecF [Mycobacteriales bacterium]|jgi:DNA replication and repair protein RecF|nr:DNA replication/repair protein RecF [Mycobacteriales bacterium]